MASPFRFSRPRFNLSATISLVAISASVTACNIFKPLDSPSGDAQVLSRARACFDKGDFSCALEYYGKLSDERADVRASEEAFVLLDQAGAGMSVFIGAFGQGGSSAGKAITKIASDLTSGAGESRRLAIFSAYKKVKGVSDPSLRGLIRFVASITLMAEILAENSANGSTFVDTDLAITPAACKAASDAACGIDFTAANPCMHPTTDKLEAGTAIAGNLEDATDSQITPNMKLLYKLTESAQQGLTELGVSSGNSTSFTAAVGDAAVNAFLSDNGSVRSPCFRRLLLNQDIGAN